MERGLPAPTRLHWIIGGLVIVICTACVGNLLSVATYDLDGCGGATLAILSPFSVLLGIWQYWALSRASRRCAELAGGFSFAFGVLGLCVFVLFLLTALADGIDDWWLKHLVPTVAASTVLLVAGYLNLRWFVQLRDSCLDVPRRGGYQATLFDVFTAVTVICVLLASWQYYARDRAPFASHVSAQRAPFRLPKDATNVSYQVTRYGARYAEFTCSESEFRHWVENGKGFGSPLSRRSLTKLEEKATTVERNWMATDREQLAPEAAVENGLVFHFTVANHTVRAVYDRDTKRAYYYLNAH